MTIIQKELRLPLELDIRYSQSVFPVWVTGAEAAGVLSVHSRV